MLHLLTQVSEEGHKHRPGHIHGAEEGGQQSQNYEGRVKVFVHRQQDLVFAPETAQDGNSTQGQRSQGKEERRHGHHLAEATHISDVQLIGAMHDASGPQEQ